MTAVPAVPAVPAVATAPTPLSQFVLKMHSRCDLACDHCYVYEHADQGWRRQPRRMSLDTTRAAAVRIAQHAAAHGLRRVRVVLHGGEPLLLGPSGLRDALTELRRAIDPVTRLDLRMQTNAVRLTAESCEVLLEHGVRVGVSLDGDRPANDRHRRFASGASSHADVVRALALLNTPRYRPLYAGLLCTVDLRNDPDATYDALLAQAPPRIDFLLPHATWEHPPPRSDGGTGYAAWLGRVYERWCAGGRPVRVRLFDALASTGTGGPSGTEWVGLSPADLAVVETDGTWEQADTLKTAYDGAAGTGLNVFAHSVDEVAALPGIAGRQVGLAGLCRTCRECPVVRQCGGGLYAHRYRAANGFDNPSVYCTDLKEFIASVNTRTPPAGPPARPPDTVPAEVFRQLAAGYGDAGAVRYLAGEQLSINRALMAAVATTAPPGGPVRDGWDTLVALERLAPQAVRAVLAHPYVRQWAVGCLDRSRATTPADPAYLCCVAAAAAARAGVPAELAVPAPPSGGQVHLPTCGSLAAPPSPGGLVTLVVRADGVSVAGTRRPSSPDGGWPDGGWPDGGWPDDGWPDDGWLPGRRLVGDGFDVLVEDLDPHRDCHGWPVLPRLTGGEATRWTALLRRAGDTLARDAPDQLPGLRAGLRALTPLACDPDGARERSSTARNAFGAVAAAATDPEALAVMLVHEFQHSKLGAVRDLCELFDPRDPRRLRVGWRPDPRPIEGALQGAYAHLAVADVWRVRAADRGDAETAGRYRRYRDWTAEALGALMASGALTAAGVALVEGLSATVSAWPP